MGPAVAVGRGGSVDVAVAETLDSGPLTPQPSGSEFTGRVTPERALVYTSGRQSSDLHQVIVGIRPTITGFRTPALIGTLLSALVLVGGAVGQWTGNVLGKIVDHSTDPAVAILIVIPSLIAAYVVREGEHEVRSKLLSVPRAVVMLTSGLGQVQGRGVRRRRVTLRGDGSGGQGRRHVLLFGRGVVDGL